MNLRITTDVVIDGAVVDERVILEKDIGYIPTDLFKTLSLSFTQPKTSMASLVDLVLNLLPEGKVIIKDMFDRGLLSQAILDGLTLCERKVLIDQITGDFSAC